MGQDQIAKFCAHLGFVKQFQTQCDKTQWWAIVHRRKLHSVARWSSKHDRILSAQRLAEEFLHTALTRNSGRCIVL